MILQFYHRIAKKNYYYCLQSEINGFAKRLMFGRGRARYLALCNSNTHTVLETCSTASTLTGAVFRNVKSFAAWIPWGRQNNKTQVFFLIMVLCDWWGSRGGRGKNLFLSVFWESSFFQWRNWTYLPHNVTLCCPLAAGCTRESLFPHARTLLTRCWAEALWKSLL